MPEITPPAVSIPDAVLGPRDVLSALYTAVLQREADEAGLAYWANIVSEGVRQGDPVETLRDVISAFLTTDEGRRKITAALSAHPDALKDIRKADALRAAQRSEFLSPGFEPLRNVIGLGTHCYTASLLSRFGCRSWSGPFDWIFSTPAMVRDCMRDRFAAYLNSSHYRFVPIEERADPDYHRVSHTLFESRYGIPAPVFNHTDAHTREGQNYLRRCVERFEATLLGDTPHRYLQILPEKAGSAAEFEPTLEALHEQAPHARLVQVIVQDSSEPSQFPKATKLAETPRGRQLTFRPISAWKPTCFDDLLDDLMLMRSITAAFHEM